MDANTDDVNETPRENEHERRKIADLKPHPLQAEVFPNLPDVEIQWLAQSIDKNGLEYPVEILPNNTILAGHQRVRAVVFLGHEEVDVFIRHDLAEAGEFAAQEYLVRDNLDRRQMDPLTIARCYKQLKQLAPNHSGRKSGRNQGDLRDQLANRFNLSGRTLDRYCRVLELPMSIQNAVSAGLLPLTQADKIANLDINEQQLIAKRISNGEVAKQVVKDFLSAKSGHRFIKNAVTCLGRNLQRSVDDLSTRLDHIRAGDETLTEYLPVFRQTLSLLHQLIERLEQEKG